MRKGKDVERLGLRNEHMHTCYKTIRTRQASFRTVAVWELKPEHIVQALCCESGSNTEAKKDCLSEILMVIARNTAGRGHVITFVGSGFDQRMARKSTISLFTLGAGRYNA